MSDKGKRSENDKTSSGREARLKAALKANLQKRKEQARARADKIAPDTADKAG